jgi:hypothetical protein
MAKQTNTPEAGIDDLGGLAAAAAAPQSPSDASSGAEATKDTKPAADASTGPVGPPAAPVVESTAKPAANSTAGSFHPTAPTLAADPTADTRPKTADAQVGDEPGTVVRDWEPTEALYDSETGKFIPQERRLVAVVCGREWEYREAGGPAGEVG